MNRFLLLSLCTSLFATSAVAKDEKTLVLEPSSQWQIDYGTERCRLARTFGEGDDQTIFWIEQIGPSSSFTWLLAGEAVDYLRSNRNIRAQFGPGFEPFDLSEKRRVGPFDEKMTLGDFGTAIQYFGYRETRDVPQDVAEASPPFVEDLRRGALDEADGAKIDYIQFSRNNRTVRLNTGNLQDGFAALNACANDLYAFWGLNPASVADAAESAVFKNALDVARRVQRSYPTKAESRGEQAVISLKVLVGPAGKVEKCVTIKQIASENFDDHACRVFSEYAEFAPAKDASGKPIRSFYSARIVYQLN